MRGIGHVLIDKFAENYERICYTGCVGCALIISEMVFDLVGEPIYNSVISCYLGSQRSLIWGGQLLLSHCEPFPP